MRSRKQGKCAQRKDGLRSLEKLAAADCSAALDASMCMESVHAAVDELRGAQWVLAWL